MLAGLSAAGKLQAASEALWAVAAARALTTAAPTGDALPQAFAHCASTVRSLDYENWLWAMQLPKELRPAVIALRAFNAETAQIADHAKSEPLILMRCQWWRDAINACYRPGQKVPEQPVAMALAGVLAHRPLTRYRLQQIVATREADMTRPVPPASLAAMEAYADGTASQLLLLQLEAAGLGEHAAAAAAAGELGRAVGLAGLLRGTLHHAQRRRTYLPADLCAAAGVAEEDMLTGRDSEGLRGVTAAVAGAARLHLGAARAVREELPPQARLLLMPAVGCGMYLDALERKGHNLFDQAILRGGFSPLAYQLRLKWALLRGRY
eukprot:scaffold13.g239.t1